MANPVTAVPPAAPEALVGRYVPRLASVAYGYLPPPLLGEIKRRYLALAGAGRAVPRSE